MNLHLIGDIHGMFEEYYQPILREIGDEPSIQLGDMGVGFPDTKFPPLAAQAKFIRGNHDNPDVCRAHPNYLGEYGYIDDWDLFYLSGAWSIDWDMRKPGVTWWWDEELSIRELNKALDLYEKVKPSIVVSHDCPEIAKISMLLHIQGRNFYNAPTRTNQILQAMFEIHQPSNWFFGHYHSSRRFQIHETTFRCVAEGEQTTITI